MESSPNPDLISSVKVISTGTVDIHPEHAYRSKAPSIWWVLTSRRWLTKRPINLFVIEHRDGLVLFDTGQDRASITDDDYFPSGAMGWLYHRLARFDIEPHEALPECLDLPGLDWDQIHPEPLDDPDIAPFTHGVDLMGDSSMILLQARPSQLHSTRIRLRSRTDICGWACSKRRWRPLDRLVTGILLVEASTRHTLRA